ncbi:MAG TPA: DUF5317 domain-containing protein [Actinomycetota bacterium]|nr:DUF5317 domain-containing protein [Actinomycetota bacterium]
MGILLAALAIAIVLGVVRGGSVGRLASLRLRAPEILLLGLGLRLALEIFGPSDGTLVGGAAFILVALPGLVFLWLNRRVAGLGLVTAGIVANLAVMSLNGGMPVSASAASLVGAAAPVDGEAPRHEELTDSTLAPWLGDVIPVPPLGRVLSVGDLLLAAGLMRLIYLQSTAGPAVEGAAPSQKRLPANQ